MGDYTKWIDTIKKAALDAVNASKPVSICYGSVTGVSPLRINVEQKITLELPQLVLTRSVSGGSALAVGDRVVLLREQGGQKYIVLDRTGGA